MQIFSSFSPELFGQIMSKLKGSKDGNPSFLEGLCSILKLPTSSEEDELCKQFKHDSVIKVSYEQLSLLNVYLPELNFKTSETIYNFSSGRIFGIEREEDWNKIRYDEFRLRTFKLKFLLRRSTVQDGDTSKKNLNILGMNFLNQKIINYDQMTNELKIADSSLPTDSQLSDFQQQLMLKTYIDLLLLLVFLVGFFWILISLDKNILSQAKYYTKNEHDGRHNQTANESTDNL